MKNILILGFILISVFFVNCKKAVNNNSAADIEVGVAIYYKDVLGNNLLIPNQPNSFSADSIHVYDVTNGKKTEVDVPNWTHPHDFFITKDSAAVYFLALLLQTDTVLLQLNKNTTDTVIATFDRTPSSIVVTKVWYNGVLVHQPGVYPSFTIIK